MVLALAVWCDGSTSVAYAGINAWTTNGPGGGAVYAVVIDPTSPHTIYAGAERGFFKSTDGAASWGSGAGLPEHTAIGTLAIDPIALNTLYAGTNGSGLFKSMDGGSNWSPLHVSARAIAVDPLVPGTLYVSTGSDAGGGVQQR